MSDWLGDQFATLPAWQIPWRLLAAVVLASCIGLEREARQKPAGLRTFALVSLGAAGFVLAVVQGSAALPMNADTVEFDPTGLIAAVAGGIGFLGAGAIINDRTRTRGMTTAAGIWISGAIGVACGVGQVLLAATIAVLALIIVVGLRWVEEHWFGHEKSDGD